MASKGKILIIDDEPDLVEAMKFRLEATGYKVLTSFDGKTGIDVAVAEKPDVILLDIMMPGMDGFEALRRIKINKAIQKIPAIVFSCGREEEGWAKRAVELGASGYVVKPFDTEALLFMIGKFCGK